MSKFQIRNRMMTEISEEIVLTASVVMCPEIEIMKTIVFYALLISVFVISAAVLVYERYSRHELSLLKRDLLLPEDV